MRASILPALAATTLTLTTLACGGAEPLPPLPVERPEPTTPDPEPARTTAHALVLDTTASAISVFVVDREERAALELDLEAAQMAALFVDGTVAPSAISVAIRDIPLAHEGLRLTDIEGAIDFDDFVLDPETHRFDAVARVRVTWSLANQDKLLPIRPLETGAIEAHGSAMLDEEGRAHFALDAFIPGVVFEAANLAELTDLSVALTFQEEEGDMIAAGE